MDRGGQAVLHFDDSGEPAVRATLVALRHSSLSMIFYRVKRIARNRLVPRVAGHYGASCRRLADRLPLVEAGRANNAASRLVARFYEQDVEKVEAAANGAFTFLGDTVDFGSLEAVDWQHQRPSETSHHMWRMKLNQMPFLHTLLASGRQEHDLAAVALMRQFSARASFGDSSAFATYWAPYEISHRLLAVLSALEVRESAAPLEAEHLGVVRDFVRMDVAVLTRNLELELMNNHTERNLAALVLFYSVCGVATPARIDRLVQRVMEVTILEDGTQVERSAMYQGLSVMSLELFAEAESLSPSTRATARVLADRAKNAWAILTHQDQEIALFNDSWWGETPRCSEVTGLPPVKRGILPSGGYLKFGGDVTALMDLGAIGPTWNPGHGHEDALSVEVDVHGLRLLVDPGTSTYDPGAQRQWERSADAHNAPRYVGVPSADFTGSFRVVKMPPEPELAHVDAVGQSAAASVATPAGRVHRSLKVSDRCAHVVDRWDGKATAETSILVPGTWALRFGPASIHCERGGVTATINVDAGQILGSQQDTWSTAFGVRESATRIYLAPEQGASPRELAFSVWSGTSDTTM